MNIIDDAWIPIQGCGRVSLLELFSERFSQYERLHGTPVEKIVIIRFLLAVAHAAVTIEDDNEWFDLSLNDLVTRVSEYLRQHRSLFELYGDKPFLQIPNLGKMAKKKLDLGSIQYHIATGNNVLVSDRNKQVDLSDAEKVVCLLQASCYGCGGKKYDNSIVLSPGYTQKGKSGRSGSLLGSRGYLHVMPMGSNIVDTLKMNLLTEEDVRGLGVFPRGIGRPFWEQMPEGEDCPRAQEYLETWQGRLFPLDKFLLLQNNQIIMTDGILYPQPDEAEGTDPGVTVIDKGAKNRRVVWAETEKKPWRELESILNFLEVGKIAKKQDPTFLSLALRKIQSTQEDKTITVWAGGLEISSNSGEQKAKGNNDFVESEFTFNIQAMNGESLIKLRILMNTLDDFFNKLRECVKQYFSALNENQSSKLAGGASRRFWTVAEQDAQEIVDVAFQRYANDIAEKENALKSKWWKLIRSIYDASCPRYSTREILAWAQYRPRFKKIAE